MKIEEINKLLDYIALSNAQLVDHSEKVAMLGYAVGKTLGLTPKEIESVYIIGLAHDIGKYYLAKIADNEINQYYPIASAIVMAYMSEEFTGIAKMVLTHQEKINGKGVLGYNATNIELFAMIINMCDFYITERENGLSHDETVVKIRAESDKRFPKKLITPFIKTIVTNEEVQFYGIEEQ